LKLYSESDDRIVAGSLFRDAGPATANAQWITKVGLGMWNLEIAVFWCLVSKAHSDNLAPWTALKTRRQSLYLTHSAMRSQWSLLHSRSDIGVSQPEWQTSRTAVFIIRWSQLKACCELFASN